ncbi:MAG: bifunctional riboflavin kinase/FAD synthetase [Defluviitaleaceae bacterium]|nr:bifunctional riboflavin kinase/FAD synthetase [Defluviitaleaceae bacterium]
MIHITNEKIEQKEQTAITIGNFDGIHKGHIKLIESTIKYAKEKKLKSLVFSFYPNPREVIKNTNLNYILTREEKKKLIKDLGVDVFVEYPFDKELAIKSPEYFLNDILKNKLNTKAIFIGENYRFGNLGKGDCSTILNFGDENGIYVSIENLLNISSEKIDSTTIRKYILSGNVIKANLMLGRSFSLKGVVSIGNQRGRTLGFPTANIIPNDYKKILPQKGVYITSTFLFDINKIFPSITNVGHNPTFDDKSLVIETFIFNFSENIYNQIIEINFFDKIRNEKKFNNIEELKEQITNDVILAKKFHKIY